MPDRALKVDLGPDSPFSVNDGKQKELQSFEGPGRLIAIYYTIDQRDTELHLIVDGEQIDMPSLTKLNTMNLNQDTNFNQAGMKVHEYYSTSPFGFAFEHSVDFDEQLELVISNESGSTATVSDFIVLWEKFIVE